MSVIIVKGEGEWSHEAHESSRIHECRYDDSSSLHKRENSKSPFRILPTTSSPVRFTNYFTITLTLRELFHKSDIIEVKIL